MWSLQSTKQHCRRACGTEQAKTVFISSGKIQVNLQEQNRQNKSLVWLHLGRITSVFHKLTEFLFDQVPDLTTCRISLLIEQSLLQTNSAEPGKSWEPLRIASTIRKVAMLN